MVLKITDFTKELFDDLKKLKEWPEKVKTMQRNWIGISHGAEIIFEIQNSSKKIKFLPQGLKQFLGQAFWRYLLNMIFLMTLKIIKPF